MRSGSFKTPWLKRLPVGSVLAVALIVGLFIASAAWLRIVSFVGILAIGWLTLRFVFGLPWSRILLYREFEE